MAETGNRDPRALWPQACSSPDRHEGHSRALEVAWELPYLRLVWEPLHYVNNIRTSGSTPDDRNLLLCSWL